MQDRHSDWTDRRDQEAASDPQTRRHVKLLVAWCPVYLLPLGILDPGSFQPHVPTGVADPVFWTNYAIWVAVIAVLFTLFLLGRRWRWARRLLRFLTR